MMGTFISQSQQFSFDVAIPCPLPYSLLLEKVLLPSRRTSSRRRKRGSPITWAEQGFNVILSIVGNYHDIGGGGVIEEHNQVMLQQC